MRIYELEKAARSYDISSNVKVKITFKDESTEDLEIKSATYDDRSSTVYLNITSSKKVITENCKDLIKQALCDVIDSVGTN